jgi:hypothetical protein
VWSAVHVSAPVYVDMVEVGGSNPPGPTKISISH